MRRVIVSFVLIVVTAFSTVCITGCNQEAYLKKITPPEEEAWDRRYIDLLRNRQFGPIIADLDPSIHIVDIQQGFTRMADAFPDEEPLSSKIVGASIFHGEKGDRSDLTFEFQFSKQWTLVELSTLNTDNSTYITSFQVQAMPVSLEQSSAFHIAGKGIPQYTTLFFALGCAALSASAFVLCLRTKELKRKWLWAILTLIGVGRFALNWNTAGTAWNIFWISLIPASAVKTAYSPWVISVSLPIGAIVFLIHRENVKRVASGLGEESDSL